MGDDGTFPELNRAAKPANDADRASILDGVNMAKTTTKKPTKTDEYKAALEQIAKLGGRQGAIATDALK